MIAKVCKSGFMGLALTVASLHASSETFGQAAQQVAAAKPRRSTPTEFEFGETTRIARDNDWTQWRGPNRTSVIESSPLAKWNDLSKLQKKWSVPLGESYSGPIVTEDAVFVTETVNKKYEVVRALDRETGKEIWSHRWDGAMTVPFFARSNGDWIRSTPIYDEGRLYVGGMCDVLVCLDAKTGQQLWVIDFVKEMKTGLPPFGNVPSPLIDGEFLYTQAGNALVKVNKATGQIVWTSLAQSSDIMSAGAFSSPIIAEIHGKRQLLVQTRLELAGVELEKGEVLWKQNVPTFRGMNVLTPLPVGNRVFTSTYQGGSFLFDIVHENGNWSVKEVWKSRLEGYMSSPVLIGNYVYMHLRNQRFACIDLESGEDKWITKGFGKYWSMIACGDRILALDESGKLLLIAANPEEFKLLENKSIADDTWAHLGIRGNEVFVRELKAMTVYEMGE
jgi:outer membrane protein assembly factor BamB